MPTYGPKPTCWRATATTYGADSKQLKACKCGNISELHIAEKTFQAMLAAERNIKLIQRHRVILARVAGSDGVEKAATAGKRIGGTAPKDFGQAVKLVGITAEDLNKNATLPTTTAITVG
jgi:hypothetical protein